MGPSEALPWLSAAGLPADAADARAWLCGALITPARGGIVCTEGSTCHHLRCPCFSRRAWDTRPCTSSPASLPGIPVGRAGSLLWMYSPPLEPAFGFSADNGRRCVDEAHGGISSSKCPSAGGIASRLFLSREQAWLHFSRPQAREQSQARRSRATAAGGPSPQAPPRTEQVQRPMLRTDETWFQQKEGPSRDYSSWEIQYTGRQTHG